MAQELDIDKIQEEAKAVLKKTKEWEKKYGKFQPLSDSVENRTRVFENILALCKRVKELEDMISRRAAAGMEEMGFKKSNEKER